MMQLPTSSSPAWNSPSIDSVSLVEVEATKDIAEEKAVVALPPPPADKLDKPVDDSKAIVAVKGM
nr:unnamed protein product [Digitaria exilis]